MRALLSSGLNSCLPKTTTGPSTIATTGLFAEEDILKGTRICEYVGDRRPWKDFQRMLNLKHLLPFCDERLIRVNRNVGIQGSLSCKATESNHSCDANSFYRQERVYGFDEHNRKKDWDAVYIVALEYIKKGQEITTCYFWDVPEQEYANCQCGSSKCTGIVGVPSAGMYEKIATFNKWSDTIADLPLSEKVLLEVTDFAEDD